MLTARIVTDPDSRRARTFEAVCVGTVMADRLVDVSGTSVERPVWACWAGPDQQLRAFMANVRLGRRIEMESSAYASRRDKKFEFLKKGGFQVVWQVEPEGSLATIYVDELFRLDPGMVDPDGIRFIVMPDEAWLSTQEVVTGPACRAVLARSGRPVDARFVRLATLFAAYLDRRTRCPIVNDPVFHAQLLYACLEAGVAEWPERSDPYGFTFENDRYRRYGTGFQQVGTDRIGLGPGLCCRAGHDAFEALLATETTRYFGQSALRKGAA